MSRITLLAVRSRGADPRSAALVAQAHALGFAELRHVHIEDLYYLEGPADPEQLARLVCDPVAQESGSPNPGEAVEVALRPGVTDPVAEQLLRACELLGLDEVQGAATATRYRLEPPLDPEHTRAIASRLLANPVIHRWDTRPLEPSFLHHAPVGEIESVPLRQLSQEGLLELSRQRRAALDQAEMEALQAHFRELGRDPSDAEFEMIAQTWSEHCVHKTFRALIQVGDQQVDGLLKTYLRSATERLARPWVRSAFVDNAGILDFDQDWEVSFKVETHNRPSAIEPFGGANTGVGGVIRDVLGVSARPIAATDVLCFGLMDQEPPQGLLHPRLIRSGVVAGIQDYGNKMGIPTVNGAVFYHPGYLANPLVFCGCLGLAPKGSHPRDPQPGDRVVVLGGRTGRDGLRGATFSSMSLDAETGQVAGASVQIGNPIVEKGVLDVLLAARDERLYTAVTDCGAGGFSSAVGEMASSLGVEVELSEAPLKYAGLAPWEIWLSEAQERMVLAVPPERLARLQELCELYQVEWTDLGSFQASGKVVVRYEGKALVDLDNAFLHEGLPRRQLSARIREPRQPEPFSRSLLEWLRHPNVASKAGIVHRYDHEVLGQTVVRPLNAAGGPSDACVLKPLGTAGRQGLVLSCGLNPELGEADPYAMAWQVVDEAIRNAVAVGGDPDRVALLDNFCWGDPRREETLGDLVEACRGCHDAALLYGAPFVSGKDSLNNEFTGADGERRSIPPTLLISALTLHPDVEAVITSDLKAAGHALYLVGPDRWTRALPAWVPAMYRALFRARHLIRACHDLSEGGLAVAAAEMCLGTGLGLHLEVDPDYREIPARLLLETDRPAELEEALEGFPWRRLGEVIGEPVLIMRDQRWSVADLEEAWRCEC